MGVFTVSPSGKKTLLFLSDVDLKRDILKTLLNDTNRKKQLADIPFVVKNYRRTLRVIGSRGIYNFEDIMFPEQDQFDDFIRSRNIGPKTLSEIGEILTIVIIATEKKYNRIFEMLKNS